MRYCIILQETDKNIFFEKGKVGFSKFEKIEPVNIRQNSIWLVIFKSMYDKEKIFDPELSHDLNGIEDFDFINRKTSFRIPTSESKKILFCLKWDNSDNYTLPDRILTSEMSQTKDIKTLSEILCGDNINLITAIEKLITKNQNTSTYYIRG